VKVKKIFLVSGKARSGKDTFCQFYIEEAAKKGVLVERLAFADALKDIASSVGWNSSKEGEGRLFLIDVGQILRGDYELRDGYVVSKITQEIAHRNTYSILLLYNQLTSMYEPNKNFWADIVIEKIQKSKSRVVIIPDWRFKNEFRAVKNAMDKKWFFKPDVFSVRIFNNRALQIKDPSETELDNEMFHYGFHNHGSIDSFRQAVKDFVEGMERQ